MIACQAPTPCSTPPSPDAKAPNGTPRLDHIQSNSSGSSGAARQPMPKTRATPIGCSRRMWYRDVTVQPRQAAVESRELDSAGSHEVRQLRVGPRG